MLKTQWKKQAKEILALAQENGVKSNFLFSTTFDRYMTQLELLERLKERLKEEDLIILPGGLKGTENLYNNEKVLKYVKEAASVASIAAICAAPSILGKLGLLKKIKACCYPGFEKFLEEAEISNENVVISKNIITSKGAGTAQQFSFKIIEYLVNKNKAEEIEKEVQWKV